MAMNTKDLVALMALGSAIAEEPDVLARLKSCDEMLKEMAEHLRTPEAKARINDDIATLATVARAVKEGISLKEPVQS